MPGSDAPENLKILKKSQWGVDFGRYRQTVGCLPQWLSSDHDGEKLGPNMALRNWDWTTRYAECWGVVSIVWHERLLRIVSLLVSKKWTQKLIINAFVPEQKSPPVYMYMYMYWCYWYNYGYGNTTWVTIIFPIEPSSNFSPPKVSMPAAHFISNDSIISIITSTKLFLSRIFTASQLNDVWRGRIVVPSIWQ